MRGQSQYRDWPSLATFSQPLHSVNSLLITHSSVDKYFFDLTLTYFYLSRQTLDFMKENKLFQKLKLISKSVNNKKHSPKLILNQNHIQIVKSTLD